MAKRIQKNKKNRKQFWLECILAVILASATLVFVLKPILFAPDDYYPYTNDGLGHLTKVNYLAQCLKQFSLPSWFAYWYNGSTVTQYYPPFSFLMMVPIQMMFGKIMITYKLFVFISIFIGAMGTWYFTYKFLGKWYGLIACVLYAGQPFLVMSLTQGGVVAQGPIYAFSPWFLVTTFSFLIDPTQKKWLLNCLLTAILILGHAMHAYMVCLYMGFAVLAMVIIGKVNLTTSFLWVTSLAFGGALTGFWALPGATGFENPALPYLIEEATFQYTPDLAWFIPLFNKLPSGLYSKFYFTMSLLVIGFLSGLSLIYKRIKSKEKLMSKIDLWIIFNFFVMFISFAFSWGQKNPVYKLLPMYKSLFPGRVLSLTSICVAVLAAYMIYLLISGNHRWILKGLLLIVVVVCITLDFNPAPIVMVTEDLNGTFQNLIGTLEDSEKTHFEKGRFTWISDLNCKISYFPLLYDYNMSDGWNIEGSTHARALWMHNVALTSESDAYVIKNLLQWNVRSVLVNQKYEGLHEGLEKLGFEKCGWYDNSYLLHSKTEPSYFFKQKRNAILIGKGGQSVSLQYPWMVLGTKTKIQDYSEEELEPYQLIYMVSPDINDIQELETCEQALRKLASQGKTIIIEHGRDQLWNLFDVQPFFLDVTKDALLINESQSTNEQPQGIRIDEQAQFISYVNLDHVSHSILQNDGRLKNAAIGTKKVDGNTIYFVGMSLSQMLQPAIINNIGISEYAKSYYSRSKEIASLLDGIILNAADTNKNIVPEPFAVTNPVWTSGGSTFSYQSDQSEDVIVSITYAPRWKAFLDGQEIKTYDLENLLMLKLPAGTHEVKLVYEITWVAKTGRVISLLAFILLLFVLKYFKTIYQVSDKIIMNTWEKLRLNNQN